MEVGREGEVVERAEGAGAQFLEGEAGDAGGFAADIELTALDGEDDVLRLGAVGEAAPGEVERGGAAGAEGAYQTGASTSRSSR